MPGAGGACIISRSSQINLLFMSHSRRLEFLGAPPPKKEFFFCCKIYALLSWTNDWMEVKLLMDILVYFRLCHVHRSSTSISGHLTKSPVFGSSGLGTSVRSLSCRRFSVLSKHPTRVPEAPCLLSVENRRARRQTRRSHLPTSAEIDDIWRYNSTVSDVVIACY
jgi:hypothetical protein